MPVIPSVKLPPAVHQGAVNNFIANHQPMQPAQDIKAHCPGLGGAYDSIGHHLIIANKGPWRTYGPTSAMRDEEAFAGTRRVTGVAFAPTQNGQATKAMFRVTSFRARWMVFFQGSGFEQNVTAKLSKDGQTLCENPPLPAHLLAPDDGVRMGIYR